MRVERGEPVDQRGDATAGRTRVDDEHHGRVRELGHVSGGREPLGAERAVEQTHHALDDGYLGGPGPGAGPVQQQRDDLVLALQVRVQVPRRPAGGEGVVAGVDVIRSDLVPGDLEAPVPQRRHQAGRHRRLPLTGRGRRDHQAGEFVRHV